MANDREAVERYLRELGSPDRGRWAELEAELERKRRAWFFRNSAALAETRGDVLERAYRILLAKLNVREEEAPVVGKTDSVLVFRSRNYCPALEACMALGLDTREVCRLVFERPTDELVRLVDPRLRFHRDYRRIRPYTDYCEEIISVSRAAAGGPVRGRQ